ncbi:hypothetical protein T492DRAFT_835670 [Pavlovales sp. CCMP2436]|nr:hypothetical protein T492DRAFT_835670 [Pavlovales sp. CCMP2436]
MAEDLRSLVVLCRDEQVFDVPPLLAKLHVALLVAEAGAGADEVRLLASSALAYLARSEHAHAYMATKPLLDTLARTLVRGEPATSREWAAMSLRYLSRLPATRARMRHAGVELARALADALCAPVIDEKTRSWAISALAYQLRDSESRELLAASAPDADGRLPVGVALSDHLVRAIEGAGGGGWELRVWAAEACASLARSEAGRALLRGNNHTNKNKKDNNRDGHHNNARVELGACGAAEAVRRLAAVDLAVAPCSRELLATLASAEATQRTLGQRALALGEQTPVARTLTPGERTLAAQALAQEQQQQQETLEPQTLADQFAELLTPRAYRPDRPSASEEETDDLPSQLYRSAARAAPLSSGFFFFFF